MVNVDIYPGFYVAAPSASYRADPSSIRSGGYWWQKFGASEEADMIYCEDIADETSPSAAHIVFWVEIKETDYAFYTQGFQSWVPVAQAPVAGDLHLKMPDASWRKVNKFPPKFGARSGVSSGGTAYAAWADVIPSGSRGNYQFAPGGGTVFRYTPLKIKMAAGLWHEVGPVDPHIHTDNPANAEYWNAYWSGKMTSTVHSPEAGSVCAWTVDEYVNIQGGSVAGDSRDLDQVASLPTYFPVGSYWYLNEAFNSDVRIVTHIYSLVDLLYVRWVRDHLYPLGTEIFLSITLAARANWHSFNVSGYLAGNVTPFGSGVDYDASSTGARNLYMYRSSVPYTVDRARPELSPSPYQPSGQGGVFIKTVQGRGVSDYGLIRAWGLTGTPADYPQDFTTWLRLDLDLEGTSLGFHLVTDQVTTDILGSDTAQALISASISNLRVVYRPPGAPPFTSTSYEPTEIIDMPAP